MCVTSTCEVGFYVYVLIERCRSQGKQTMLCDVDVACCVALAVQSAEIASSQSSFSVGGHSKQVFYSKSQRF